MFSFLRFFSLFCFVSFFFLSCLSSIRRGCFFSVVLLVLFYFCFVLFYLFRLLVFCLFFYLKLFLPSPLSFYIDTMQIEIIYNPANSICYGTCETDRECEWLNE